MDFLEKFYETTEKIYDILKDVNESGNYDTLSLKVYMSY